MNAQDNQKRILLQQQLAINPDMNYTRSLGAIRMPPGFALMKCDSGYYFLKWDGEASVCSPDKYMPIRWARDNYNYHEKRTA